MILSVFSPVLANKTLEDSLKYLKSLKVDAMELGCGGYPGTAHADAKELIKSDAKVRELKGLFKSHGIAISALSVHGNCVHPDPAVAAAFEADYRAACELAGKCIRASASTIRAPCSSCAAAWATSWAPIWTLRI